MDEGHLSHIDAREVAACKLTAWSENDSLPLAGCFSKWAHSKGSLKETNHRGPQFRETPLSHLGEANLGCIEGVAAWRSLYALAGCIFTDRCKACQWTNSQRPQGGECHGGHPQSWNKDAQRNGGRADAAFQLSPEASEGEYDGEAKGRRRCAEPGQRQDHRL